MQENKVKLALIHAAIRWNDKDYNLSKLLALNEQAAANGARIIVNPELSTTGYSFDSIEEIVPLAETIPGPTTELFCALACRYRAYICLGLPEVDPGTGIIYNAAVLIGSQGEVLGRHRKLAPAFRENLWAARGNLPVLVAEIEYGKMAVLICADVYSYKPARMAVLKGARLLLIPVNWPPHHYQPDIFWRTRAAENRVYVAVCNRTGLDKTLNCNSACSCIIDPDGTILEKTQSSDETILYGTIPLKNGKFISDLAGKRLANRRPELYSSIALDTFTCINPEFLLGLPQAKKFTVATVQFCPFAGKSRENTGRILSLIEQSNDMANQRGMKLNIVVLPELASTGLINDLPRIKEEAEEIPGPTVNVLAEKAKERDIYIVLGMVEREEQKYFNTAVLIGPSGLIGKYQKIHLTLQDERWADSSQRGFCFFDLPFARIGILIGYDLMFPEAVESLAKWGVDLLCVPALWSDRGQFIWEARIAEQMHLVIANQWGFTGNFRASGGSLIYTYSWYPEKRLCLKSPGQEDKINILLLNSKDTRQKRFLEQVDYTLLLNKKGER